MAESFDTNQTWARNLVGYMAQPQPVPALPAFAPSFSLVEGWRGAIIHWVMADADGRLHRVKVMDPSFLNWRPLSYALLKNIVPDFPLCNKSFNQSYSGNDLYATVGARAPTALCGRPPSKGA